MIRIAVMLGMCLPLMLGCGGPSAEDSEQVAEDMRERVHETVRTIVAGLAERGVEVAEATGSYAACGLQKPQVEYSAAVRTTGASGTVEEQIQAAREVIEGLGLPMVESDAPNFVSTDASKDELRVSANEAKAEPGTLAIQVVRDCEDVEQSVGDERLSRGVETIE